MLKEKGVQYLTPSSDEEKYFQNELTLPSLAP
jgi:hypothetical protein